MVLSPEGNKSFVQGSNWWFSINSGEGGVTSNFLLPMLIMILAYMKIVDSTPLKKKNKTLC